MLSLSAILSLSLLTVSSARSLPSEHLQREASGISWSPCPKELNVYDPRNRTFDCGTLKVPLDYSNKSSTDRLTLNLIRIPALKGPKLGSILFNWGGPGGDGLINMASASSIVQPMTGPFHDLISWDPRGTGQTLSYSCYANSSERTLAQASLRLDLANASDTALGRSFAEGKIRAGACKTQLNATGDLVGTAFTVRDMFQIVDNLGEDGMLRYWGLSYGTTLGATALAMFPDRIDRAVLDGVQNPHEYYHTYGDPQAYTDTDAVWEQFLWACMENPGSCPLSKHASDATDLERVLDDFFHDIKYNPILVGSLVIDYTLVKAFIWGKLYYPKQYILLATALEAVLTRNETTLALALSPQQGSTDPTTANASPEAQIGIKCGDKFLRSDDIEPLEASLHDEIYKNSARFGDSSTLDMTTCAQWGFKAKERYDGDFKANTSYPALIIGNTCDPVTPIVSAFNISSGFDGSVVLRHNGHGHMSISQASTCTSKYIAAYFINGTLPAPGTSCEPDEPLFAAS